MTNNIPESSSETEIYLESGLLRSDGTIISCQSSEELEKAYTNHILRTPVAQISKSISHAIKRIILLGGVIPVIHDEEELFLILKDYLRQYESQKKEGKFSLEDFFGNPRIQKEICDFILVRHEKTLSHNQLEKIFYDLQNETYKKIDDFRFIITSSKSVASMSTKLHNLIVFQDSFFTPQDILLGIQTISLLEEDAYPIETKIQFLRHFQDFFQSFVIKFGKSGREGRIVKFALDQSDKKI